MKESVEEAKCDDCGTEHQTFFPVAESQEEYDRELVKLPTPNIIGKDGEIRTRVPCENSSCNAKIGIPIFGKGWT